MATRAAKMRNKLGHIKADREQFEMKRKELEAEMNKGKHGLAEIQKGLKHHVINVTECEHHEEDAHHSNKKHAKLHKTPSKGPNEIGKNGHAHAHAHGGSPVATANNATAAIPTAPRISDWCYTGLLDSMPPVVKEQNLYETTRLLGRGAFGEVNLAKNKDDNKLFAIKTMLCMEQRDLEEALMEVRYLRLNRHACIIDVCDVFLTDKTAKVLHITMSYCEAGDLGVIISTNKKNNSNVLESQILKWMTQVSLALEFCHSNQFIHRDLKPCNVLLSEGGQYVRLGDFGLATEIKKLDTNGGEMQEAGTPLYTAPEVIKSLPYSFPVDCWSFGVMLYELISLRPPFNGNNTTDLVRSIVSEDYIPPALPEHYSDELKTLCLSLLNRNHVERPAMVEILETPVFHQKAKAFPGVYRPMHQEERVRRFYAKAMVHQIETFPSKVEKIVAQRKIDLAAQKVEAERIAAEATLKEQQALAAATKLAPQPIKMKDVSHVVKERVVEKPLDSTGTAAVSSNNVVGDALNLSNLSAMETNVTASAETTPVKGGRVGQQIADAQEAGKLLKSPSETETTVL